MAHARSDSFALENAETIEAPSPLRASSLGAAVAGASDSLPRLRRGLIALVEGSSPHLTSETRDLLRQRLRMAAILLFASFAVFLIYALRFEAQKSDHRVFYIHCFVTTLMGLMVWYLSQSGEMSLRKLRFAELLVFGDPALFFVAMNLDLLHQSANSVETPHLPIIVVPWLMLIFIYALFIPNNWRRATAVLVPMGLAPLIVLVWQYSNCPGFNSCMQSVAHNHYLTAQVLEMILATVIAILGVRTINNLRTEAFEAKQLGQYRLKHRLGSGGMGEVYMAEHQMMKRPCAVKIIRPEKAGDATVLARFEREVRSTAKLSHWNSIDIYDYGNTADGTFYYVMEYLPGHNIGELIDIGGPLPPERVIYLMTQVCSALAEAHNTGLVHRDIKPANIFCAYRGGEFDVAKLLDFGLAKPLTNLQQDTALTQEGSITGSPLFMSPEQATGEREADARSDIYSLGAVLYYMLTGQPPFNYKQAVKVIIAHASEQPVPLRKINPDVPEALEEITLRCLEKDPDHRYQTVEALRSALQQVQIALDWDSGRAAEWWSCNGCPERKALAAAALEAAARGESCPWPSAARNAKPELVAN